MVLHKCLICNKVFNKKSTYDYHINNKKKLCNPTVNIDAPNCTKIAPNCTKIAPNCTDIYDIILKNTHSNNNNHDDIVNKNNVFLNKNNNSCSYCNKIFTRNSSLQRHLNNRCKSKNKYEETKKYYDELDELKKQLMLLTNNYQHLENNYQHLENNYQNLIKNNNKDTVHENKIINNNQQINKGVILNNTLNIQVVQFGEEDIDKLNLTEAIKHYLTSTGGNIVSNMLKYININDKYPENHNICITDLSREIVKIHNGKKFIYKKFKNVKNDILNKIVKNTRKIVDKCVKDEKIKKSHDMKTKLKINDVSLKLIDGMSGEDIVREEIKEKEKELKNNNLSYNHNKINKDKNEIDNDIEIYTESDTDSETEREFTFEERLRVEHLDKKREGLQNKTFENIKDELYNGKEIFEKYFPDNSIN
jgi:hypothetical protein